MRGNASVVESALATVIHRHLTSQEGPEAGLQQAILFLESSLREISGKNTGIFLDWLVTLDPRLREGRVLKSLFSSAEGFGPEVKFHSFFRLFLSLGLYQSAVHLYMHFCTALPHKRYVFAALSQNKDRKMDIYVCVFCCAKNNIDKRHLDTTILIELYQNVYVCTSIFLSPLSRNCFCAKEEFWLNPCNFSGKIYFTIKCKIWISKSDRYSGRHSCCRH